MFVITGATSAHAPNFNLSTPAFSQDFEASESTLPTIHARGITQQSTPDFKPYVYGMSSRRAQLQVARAAQHVGHFINP